MAGSSIFGLGGWLFADLMLALMVLGLAQMGDEKHPNVAVTPVATSEALMVSPTRLSASGITPVPVAPDAPLGLDPERVERSILVSEDGVLHQQAFAIDELRGQVEAAFSTEDLQGRRAGLVITFGRAPLSDPNRGVRLARAVNAVLAEHSLFHGAVQESFLMFNPPSNTNVEIWVYLLAETR